jgi:F5/8 type C domain/Glycosyl hydrolases family 39
MKKFFKLVWLAIFACNFLSAQTVSVDFTKPTGVTIGKMAFGTNGFQAFDPAYATNATYKANMAEMAPGIVRYHSYNMITPGHPCNWLNADNKSWNAAKISQAFANANQYTTELMINIPWIDGGSGWLDNVTGKLNAANYADFANLCASLVKIVNVDLGKNVKYWEITNEQDGRYRTDIAELSKIYNQCAVAMKAVDNNIKTGGLAYERADIAASVETFMSNSKDNIDFLSYHTYLTGDPNATNTAIYDASSNSGYIDYFMRTTWAKYSTRPVEYFHDEFNVSYAPPDVKQTNGVGLVSDALTYIAIVNNGGNGLSWNECDGWYGKMNNDFSKRPSFYLAKLFNKHLLNAPVFTSSSSDNSKVVSWVAKGVGNWWKLVVVNRADADLTVNFNLTGLPQGVSDTSLVYSDAALGWGYYLQGSTTVGNLKTGVALASQSTAIFTFYGGDGTPPPPGPPNIALNKAATASSIAGTGFEAGLAFDGNAGSRWSSNYTDPSWVYVDLGATYNISGVKLNWESAYGKAYSIEVTDNPNGTWTSIYNTTNGDGGTDDLSGLSGTGRYVRMYGTTRGTPYGYSLYDFEVYGTAASTPPPTTNTNNIALYKPAVSSSTEKNGLESGLAFDGNIYTRWSSSFYDQQWVYADLGDTYSINRVKLDWDGAYAKSYRIEVANNPNGTWTSIYSTTTGDGGIDDLTGLSGSGRYVRMYGVARGTPYGFSLNEFEVYGTVVTGSNVALYKAAVSSSTEKNGLESGLAFDGNTSTRWSSTFYDQQWIYVDLATSHAINRVKLNWEGAYGKAYQIQVANDPNGPWTNLFTTTTGDGGIDDITGLSGSGRYVRMYGMARGTPYGYSLYEFDVYGNPNGIRTAATTKKLQQTVTPAGLQLMVYPNPAFVNGSVTVKLSGQKQQAVITVYKADGKLEYTLPLLMGETKRITGLSRGVHVIKITGGDLNETRKIIVN